MDTNLTLMSLFHNRVQSWKRRAKGWLKTPNVVFDHKQGYINRREARSGKVVVALTQYQGHGTLQCQAVQQGCLHFTSNKSIDPDHIWCFV